MKEVTEIETHLGTPIVLTLCIDDGEEERAHQALGQAFQECARIDASYSRFKEGNVLAALNAQCGQWVEVDEELHALLSFGEEMKQRTGGAFDLSVKSILEGWGYDAGYSLKENTPGETGSMELQEGKVRLSVPIELGGIGKGYAIDRINTLLESFPNVYINAGGDLRLRGCTHEGKAWRIIFEHPQDPQQGIGYVESTNLALGCSSPSRRAWRNRHHLVNPLTKEPADEMLAVYTQAPTALLADAYSTALFALGYSRAKTLLSSFPVAALLVGPQGQMHKSAGFKGDFFGA